MKRYVFRMNGMMDVEELARSIEERASDAEGSEYAAWMRAEAKRVREQPDVFVKLEDVRWLLENAYENAPAGLLVEYLQKALGVDHE